MEKLNLEVTVVVTEKLAIKKELDRVDGLYNSLRKDFKEQRINYDLLIDEVSKANKQNNRYRGLIVENEEKFSEFEKEVQELKSVIDLKNKAISRSNQEK